MTAGNNGASTPEDDDPFGYLYADGQAAGATPPNGGGGYGYPGRSSSYQQVRPVGERQYGQHGAGQQAPPQNAHYAAPETLPGGQQRRQQYADDGRGGGRGPNTRGLLIGAVAVVAAVVIGIGVAMLTNNGEDDPNSGGNQAGSSAGSGADGGQEQPNDKPDQNAGAEVKLPKEDAKALTFTSGLSTAKEVPGAQADGGTYVAGFNTVGAKVSWTFSMKKAGDYKLRVRYGIPGEDADATLVVNGKPNTQPLGMKNFINSPKGDWEKGWQSTWAPVSLHKGTNVVEITCGESNKCDANLDQVWLEKG
ncbi:CBM35 domain-containing protein [Streptomyces boluensis]|uniref:Carbohydrate-binding protein n=1 Tax=Streptomyces boluensis TaxID=1775135 RepID=A0A964USR4_9ACTN|nr:CBM35 domain-containing protein [Streptomyces boluensis]NBE54641.1 carbohydrate-binding protein [Streptomyces boluensis]